MDISWSGDDSIVFERQQLFYCKNCKRFIQLSNNISRILIQVINLTLLLSLSNLRFGKTEHGPHPLATIRGCSVVIRATLLGWLAGQILAMMLAKLL